MRCVILTGIYLLGLALADLVNAQGTDLSATVASLRSPQESVRIEAIDTLGRLRVNDGEVILALAALLEDNSALVRAHAVYALSEIGEPARAAIPKIAKLAGDPDATVRRGVVRAARRIRPGPEVSVPLLLKMMGDADQAVRVRAVDALTDLGEAAVPQLVLALENDDIRYWVILALGQIAPDSNEVVSALVNVAADERARPEVRREAILALGEMGTVAAPAVAALTAALGDAQLSGAAAYALGGLGPIAKPAEAELEALSAGEDAFLRTVSAWALARIAPEDTEQVQKSVRLLTQGLKSPDERVRQAAARAIADLKSSAEVIMPALDEAMADADETALAASMDVLATLGEAAVPRLVAALKHESTRPRAIRILRQLGPAALPAVSALVDLLKVEDFDTRREALFALADLGPAAKDAVPALIDVLQTADTRTRYAAVYALGRIGPEAIAAKPALTGYLGSDDEFLALSVAWALAHIDPQCELTSPKTVPILIAGLRGPDPRTRLEAAASLRCLGPLARPATDELQQSLKDESPFVRDMAAEALKAIRGEEASAVRPESQLPQR